MKTNPRLGKAAFTLIELMAVITIIVILAGLVIGGMGYVSERQAKEKAKVQIALLSKALEEYKLDTGAYPPTGNVTSFTSGGIGTSARLFKALYWDSDNDSSGAPGDTDQRIYIPELDPVTSKQGWTTIPAGAASKITDPWGNEYCYRSEFGVVPATGSAPTNAATENPGFDLWSMGKNGKTNANLSHADCRDDIRP